MNGIDLVRGELANLVHAMKQDLERIPLTGTWRARLDQLHMIIDGILQREGERHGNNDR